MTARAAQLALWPVHPTGGGRRRTSGLNGANQYTREQAAKAQLARCNRLLALEEAAKRPRFRRCDICLGREDTAAPHVHATVPEGQAA